MNPHAHSLSNWNVLLFDLVRIDFQLPLYQLPYALSLQKLWSSASDQHLQHLAWSCLIQAIQQTAGQDHSSLPTWQGRQQTGILQEEVESVERFRQYVRLMSFENSEVAEGGNSTQSELQGFEYVLLQLKQHQPCISFWTVLKCEL